jgi:hypothetical protein
MSRGRKRRRSKPKAHLVEYKRDISKEKEFLNAEVDPTKLGDYGDDALMKAIIYDLPNASEAEAMEIALALQKRVRGDASLLENPDLDDVIAGIRQEAREVDKAAEDFEKNRHSFVESVMASAPKLTDKQKEALQAKGSHEFKEAINNVKTGKSMKQMQFKAMIANAPREEILVTGQMRVRNGRNVIEPEIVSIMGMRFKLDPGTNLVPAPIAQAYKHMQETRNQARKKMALMSGEGADKGWYDQGSLASKLAEVDQEYGSN